MRESLSNSNYHRRTTLAPEARGSPRCRRRSPVKQFYSVESVRPRFTVMRRALAYVITYGRAAANLRAKTVGG
jgi:hypothetical protein